MKTLIVLPLFWSIAGSSFAQEKIYTVSDTSISVSMGETFYIKMESNRTTGYSWSLGEISEGAQVVILGSEYTSEPGIPGKGGEESWHFKALGPGNIKLVWNYIRPWEKGELPAKIITFRVEVK